jgi:hypothetical protein
MTDATEPRFVRDAREVVQQRLNPQHPEICRGLCPGAMARLHADHRAWLEGQPATPFDDETTVITYHAPLEARADTHSRTVPAYASDPTGLIDPHRPSRWRYGHTHRPEAIDRRGTQVRHCGISYPLQAAGAQHRGFGPVDLDDGAEGGGA